MVRHRRRPRDEPPTARAEDRLPRTAAEHADVPERARESLTVSQAERLRGVLHHEDATPACPGHEGLGVTGPTPGKMREDDGAHLRSIGLEHALEADIELSADIHQHRSQAGLYHRHCLARAAKRRHLPYAALGQTKHLYRHLTARPVAAQ